MDQAALQLREMAELLIQAGREAGDSAVPRPVSAPEHDLGTMILQLPGETLQDTAPKETANDPLEDAFVIPAPDTESTLHDMLRLQAAPSCKWTKTDRQLYNRMYHQKNKKRHRAKALLNRHMKGGHRDGKQHKECPFCNGRVVLDMKHSSN